MATSVRKPKPKHIETVCDVCGLDWKRHGKAPTMDKCVELLKADLVSAKQPAVSKSYPIAIPNATYGAAGTTYAELTASPFLAKALTARGIPTAPETQVGKIEKAH